MSQGTLLLLVYAMSLLSGAAALIYEVVWFRSLSLIFGGAHLAVTTTVSVFMLGLTLGNRFGGRYLCRSGNMLARYSLLEAGIALFAGIFLLLVKVYPHLYVPLARVAPESPAYLTLVRTLFALAAMIVPTTLMGATLPVLTNFAATSASSLARHLSFIYGLNTLGAVLGAASAGYWLLRFMPVSRVTLVAVAISLAVAAVSFLCRGCTRVAAAPAVGGEEDAASSLPGGTGLSRGGLILWGIALSGFCALGYEILWTRALIIFLDASTYSFTAVLVAFLAGIGLGGASYGVAGRFFRAGKAEKNGAAAAIAGFGVTQILIGVSTFLAMLFIFHIPSATYSWGKLFFERTGSIFAARQLGNFVMACTLLSVPAFFMGLAVPLAGRVHALHRKTTGQAAGEVLAFNTLGALLGGVVSGFLLIHLFGIERSMQILVLLNIGLGLTAVAGAKGAKLPARAIPAAVVALLAVLLHDDSAFKTWDRKYLGSYSANMAELFQEKSDIVEDLKKKELLYYAEGSEAIVSVLRAEGSGLLSFSVNGRIEASTKLGDVQNQYALGHLPMILHPNPRKALVVGLGSGMTLGAVSVHPSLESVTVAEIEPQVLGVARTFGRWTHEVMDNPKLKVVINDGRNFLLTSQEDFDVITADPIHPSWRGAGYLYTDEYFRLVAAHLAPGGVVCQWLPLYQLSVEDVKSIVGTFAKNFPHVMAWLTLTDVQLVGSNEPLTIEEEAINRRITQPEVRRDLDLAMMEGVPGLFTHYFFGTRGASEFSAGARINTDDNVYLEFSSPMRIGLSTEEPKVLEALAGYRESIASSLVPLGSEVIEQARAEKLEEYEMYHEIAGPLQRRFLLPRPFSTEQEWWNIEAQLRVLPDIGLWKSLKLSLAGLPREEGVRP